jgi:hypothetical protein
MELSSGLKCEKLKQRVILTAFLILSRRILAQLPGRKKKKQKKTREIPPPGAGTSVVCVRVLV